MKSHLQRLVEASRQDGGGGRFPPQGKNACFRSVPSHTKQPPAKAIFLSRAARRIGVCPGVVTCFQVGPHRTLILRKLTIFMSVRR